MLKEKGVRTEVLTQQKKMSYLVGAGLVPVRMEFTADETD